MDIESIRDHCLQKPGTTEEFPFGEDTLVFKVLGKMFLAVNVEKYPLGINLKCDPAKALELRDRYEEVQPGYHMNKKHWNTVTLGGEVPSKTLRGWIDDSYTLAARGLRKKERESLGL